MKWYGEIGFKEIVTEARGVHSPKIIPRMFVGDILRSAWGEQQGNKINADMHVTNRLSVVADQYLQNNFHKIAYIEFEGAKWTVSNVEKDPDRPRLTISLGPLYKEEEEVDEDED